MDNFQSSDLLVGNEPLKTKPELGIDPRLVGNRFVSSLAFAGKTGAFSLEYSSYFSPFQGCGLAKTRLVSLPKWHSPEAA